MNRKEFLRKLQLELYKLPRHEIDDAIAYYNEYFEEAGPDQEQAVIKELGTPSKIATQIKADYAVRQLESMESNRGNRNGGNPNSITGSNAGSNSGFSGGSGYNAETGSGYNAGAGSNKNDKAPGKLSAAWWVVIGIVGGIFAAPVAIPVAFALAALLIALFIGTIALLIAALVTTIVLIVLSVVAVIVGLTLLATSGPLALLVIGMGLMGISLMGLLTVGIVALTNMFFRFIARKHREGQVNRAQKKHEKLLQRNQATQAQYVPEVPATQAVAEVPATQAGAETPVPTEPEIPVATPEEFVVASNTEKGGDKDEQ